MGRAQLGIAPLDGCRRGRNPSTMRERGMRNVSGRHSAFRGSAVSGGLLKVRSEKLVARIRGSHFGKLAY